MRDQHKQGKVYAYKNLIFWAQGGVICIEDKENGDFNTVTAAEFAARIITVREILAKDRHRFTDERNEDHNFILNGCACVKEARKQGDPFDPAVIAYMNRHRGKSYIFTGDGTAVVSNAISHSRTDEGNVLPPIPKAPENKPIKTLYKG